MRLLSQPGSRTDRRLLERTCLVHVTKGETETQKGLDLPTVALTPPTPRPVLFWGFCPGNLGASSKAFWFFAKIKREVFVSPGKCFFNVQVTLGAVPERGIHNILCLGLRLGSPDPSGPGQHPPLWPAVPCPLLRTQPLTTAPGAELSSSGIPVPAGTQMDTGMSLS